MKYSIVIPTRRRVDTLRHAVSSVLAIDRDDFELVVHHAGVDRASEEVVAGFGDRRVRYASSAVETSMSENWESAVAMARGDYVTVIGDDDGLLPSALDTADVLIAEHQPELLSWRPVTYYWPDTVAASHAGFALHLYDLDRSDNRMNTQRVLREVFAFRRDYSDLPMIYNSFVSRQVLGRIAASGKKYFQYDYPDVSSGVMNAIHADWFVWSNYPLSISGLSAQSTGGRAYFHEDTEVQEVAAAEGGFARTRHALFEELPNLAFGLANELALLHGIAGVDKSGAALDPRAIAEYLARTLADHPQRTAARMALARFCGRQGVDFERLVQAYNMDGNGSPANAFSIRRGANFVSLHHDLAREGVADVAAAAQAVQRLLGPRRHLVAPVPAQAPSIDPEDRKRIVYDFSANGNAVGMLGAGWHQSEVFGTWAADEHAEIILAGLPAHARMRMQVFLRAPLLRKHPKFSFELCADSNRENYRGVVGPASARLSADLLIADSAVQQSQLKLQLISEALINPAKMGVSTDNRRLGIGIERVVVSLD